MILINLYTPHWQSTKYSSHFIFFYQPLSHFNDNE